MFINIKNLKSSHQIPVMTLDIFMLALVSLNLTWIVFDTLFTSELFRAVLNWISVPFTEFYADKVHPDFVSFDLIFVAIFLTEFSLRWIAAIIAKTYHRWFFYPFIHWYDLIGCIPVGSFRWLRLLRVISILYRLQQYGVIDLTNTAAGRFCNRYYKILVEEVSDRVVENVLSGVQEEVKEGAPVLDTILLDVLLPKKVMIANWLTVKINEICEEVYLPNQGSLKQYVQTTIAQSIASDAKVAALEAMPVLGPKLVNLIEQTVSDLVYQVVNRMLLDAGKQETDQMVSELLDGVIHRLLQPSDGATLAGKEILIEVIDVLKTQVRVQRWRQLEVSTGH